MQVCTQECVQVLCVHTCAINWMILTKILRGMSLGTTLRLPLGNKVEVMDVRRLGDEGERQTEREETIPQLNHDRFHYLLMNYFHVKI